MKSIAFLGTGKIALEYSKIIQRLGHKVQLLLHLLKIQNHGKNLFLKTKCEIYVNRKNFKT